MGKKSIKKNKNIYQITREELNLTREQASELLEYISSERIEKIESEKSLPHPEEVLTMSKCYKKPELCNYFCTHECAIGEETVHELKMKDISQITIDLIYSLNEMYKQKDRLIEIAVDGQLTEDEYEDFKGIYDQLNQMSLSINTLKLWLNKNILDGNINEEF